MVKGKPEYWLRRRPKDQIYDLCLLLNNICDEIIRLQLFAKISFIKELGCDLIRYNRIAVPALWMLQQQSDLDEWLPMLHTVTKEVNYKLGARTPWALDAIYKHDGTRKFYPRYHLLIDGLHPTREIACRIMQQITKDVSEAHHS